MQWAEWKMSARLAAQDRFLCWTSVAAVAMVLTLGFFFLIKVLPTGWRTGMVTMHYNIYLGIDDVRIWPWAFFVPGLALAIVLVDILMAFGIFRGDALAARALMAIGLVSSVVWGVGCFFLILVNT